MSVSTLAFFTGFFGSLHCAAMCGPLVMSLPLSGNSWLFNFIQRVLYQSGRIATYSAFGFAAGMVGTGFNILGLQQILAFVSGGLLISIAVAHFLKLKTSRFNNYKSRMVMPIASYMGRWLSKPYGGFFAGSIHGLLPCGMVYMALAASLNTGVPIEGAKFMFFFGLGTAPMLLAASLAPLFLHRFKVPASMLPVLFLIAGFFLLSRGLNLDIPYVSMPIGISDPATCK